RIIYSHVPIYIHMLQWLFPLMRSILRYGYRGAGQVLFRNRTMRFRILSDQNDFCRDVGKRSLIDRTNRDRFQLAHATPKTSDWIYQIWSTIDMCEPAVVY